MDLALLAGLEPAGVLVEVLNEDGTMARRPALEAFASEHGLKVGTVADLIRYRLSHEKNVECVHQQEVSTAHGRFRLQVFRDSILRRLHWALVRGDIAGPQPVPVRVHVPELLGDVLGIVEPQFGMPLDAALADIARRGRGVALVLGYDEDDESRLAGLVRQDGSDSRPADADRTARELRSYGIAAQILVALGVRSMTVYGDPIRFHALGGFGLEVADHVLPGQDTSQE